MTAGSGDLSRVPAREDWANLRDAFAVEVRERFSTWIDPGQAHFEDQLSFALGRFGEGVELLRYFNLYETRLRGGGGVLDVGAGNGGVAFAFGNCPSYRVHAIDIVPNPVFSGLNRRRPTPVCYTVGSGHDLPYRPESFDLVLLVDAIEHIPDRRRLGSEIMRVLRPGGICMVSTAARLRYLLGRDPHYGVRGLVALPNGVQRFVVDRLLRRRIRTADGSPWPAYDVEHTFWTVVEIGRLFPEASTVEGLYGRPLVGNAPRFSGEWWRWKARGFLFDHVIVVKAGPR